MNKLEKLNTNDTRPEVIIEKVNELIDAHNKLAELYDDHYHETLDTHYNTTSPKDEPQV